MTDFGVVPTGFKLKTLEDILAELEAAEKVALGAALNTQPDSVIGQINAIIGDQLKQLWLVTLAVYRSLYPDSATDEALDNVLAITGVQRLEASSSRVQLALFLAPGTNIPKDSIVAIDTVGRQWKTTEAVSNTGLVYDVFYVVAASVDTGPIVGAAYAIDTIVTPISGWEARATLFTKNSENFALDDSETILISVDGGDDQTIIFDSGDFGDITAALASEVVDAINAQANGFTAYEWDGGVMLRSDTDGPGSSLRCNGGTATIVLGLVSYLVQGFNFNFPATIESAAGLFGLTNADTLTLEVDGSLHTVTFNTGDFVDITNATAEEVCVVINTDLAGIARAYVHGAAVALESLTAGNDSTLEITGGLANDEFAFALDLVRGESHDADLGRDEETNAEARLRREELLRQSGAGTLEAIRSGVRALDDVNQVFVFENDTDDDPDANGLPPHSFEVVVSGGADQDIADKIFELKPVGIKAFGADGPVVVTDSQEIDHDIYFTRPDEFDEYIAVTVKVDADVYGGGDTAEGTAQVVAALLAFGDTLTIGDDVIINKFIAAAIEVAGVLDVTVMKIEDANPPTNTTNIAIAVREVALFASARIAVTVV